MIETVFSENGVPIRPTDERWAHITDKRYLWSSYDEEADVLYINFKKPSYATDSELTDDDVIIRYQGNDIIGLTILHASRRSQG